MNPPTTVQPDSPFDSQAVSPANRTPTRPLYWSVRRELWENRSVYLAPLIVTAFVLFGTLISLIGLPRRLQAVPAHDLMKQQAVVVKPFCVAPAPIMLAAFLVGVFYSLDALHGERRDRSILLWKSLPVSDLTTVLSKASLPLVVLPLIAFALSVVTLVILLVPTTAILLANGVSPAALWAEVLLEPLVMLYGLVVHTLWFAPIYAWLLLVSVWARRTPVLWAALPPFALSVVERLAFDTTHVASMLKYRVVGAMARAFDVKPHAEDPLLDQLAELAPARFLSTPGLWIGLALAAAFLAAAVRLRRDREPT